MIANGSDNGRCVHTKLMNANGELASGLRASAGVACMCLGSVHVCLDRRLTRHSNSIDRKDSVRLRHNLGPHWA